MLDAFRREVTLGVELVALVPAIEVADAAQARPADATLVEPQRELPTWYVRGAAGLGVVVESEQEDALQLQGYGNEITSYWGLDAAYFPWARLGLGPWAMWSERGDDDAPGPFRLEERVFGGGVQASWVIAGAPQVLLVLAPRIGVVTGRQQFLGGGEFVEGPALGFDFSITFPKLYAGLSVGMFTAPVPASGEAGAPGNFGRGYAAIVIHVDG